MALKQRVAVTLPAGTAFAETAARVRWAAEVGYDDAWFGDNSSYPDALTTAAALANVTKRLRIGTAVTPVFTRTPAVLAATAATLSDLLQGRFVLGLGSSSETMVNGWNGVPLVKPLAHVRDAATMVRSMLRGEKSAFALETLRSHGYQQDPAPYPVPIFIAALRQRMIEMAAAVGDGVILNLWPKAALAEMIKHIRIGADAAGKDWQSVEIVNRHHVLVTHDKPAARDLFRASFAPYYATAAYNKFLGWAGYEKEAAAIRIGWAARNRNMTMSALTDTIVDQIAIIGDEDECRERVRWCAEMGIHTHIIAPLSGASERDVQRTFDSFRPSTFQF